MPLVVEREEGLYSRAAFLGLNQGDAMFPEAAIAKPESVTTRKSLAKPNELMRWAAQVSAGLALSIGMATAIARSTPQQSAKTEEKIGTVRQIYNGTLYPDIQVQTFRNIDRLFPTRTIRHGTYVYSLSKSETPLKSVKFTSAGKKYDVYDYISLNRVSGLLVLKNGKIAFERYELGNTETTRWMSMSMVKSMSSTLVGVAIRDGYIKSIEDPITKYLPTLAGSAYEGVTVRNLLQMASGVRWDETYTNPASDRRRMLEAQLAADRDRSWSLCARFRGPANRARSGITTRGKRK